MPDTELEFDFNIDTNFDLNKSESGENITLVSDADSMEIPDELLDTEVVTEVKVEPKLEVHEITNPIYSDNEFMTSGLELVEYDDVSPNPNKSELKSVFDESDVKYIKDSPKLNKYDNLYDDLDYMQIENTKLDSITENITKSELKTSAEKLNDMIVMNLPESSVDNSDVNITVLNDTGRTNDEMKRKLKSELELSDQLSHDGYIKLYTARKVILDELSKLLEEGNLDSNYFSTKISELHSMHNSWRELADESKISQATLDVNAYNQKNSIQDTINKKIILEMNSTTNEVHKQMYNRLIDMNVSQLQLFVGILKPMKISELVELAVKKIESM
jgi:hypothetical protein